MIIHSSRALKNYPIEENKKVINDVKTVVNNNEVIRNNKSKKKKTIPTPIIEEPVVEVVEEKVEDEDLSKWLED